jgi:uncharacterized protein YndB with AHSA1/START domain
MPEFDVVDEAVLAADPATVFQALLDEAMAITRWWLPHLEMKPRGGTPPNQVGGVVDITIHRPGKPSFAARTAEIVQNERCRVEYVEGDFSGGGTWTVEPIGNQTRLRYHWQARPTRLLFRLLSPFIDMGKMHSEVMKAGFGGLDEYLRGKKEGNV